MDDRTLSIFLTVADSQSMSEAARRAYLTQSAISKRIAALEDELGSALFFRTPTGLTLTPAGRRLEPMARDLWARSLRMRSAFSTDATETGLVLASMPGISELYVVPFVADSGAPITEFIATPPHEVIGELSGRADLGLSSVRPTLPRVAMHRAADIPVRVHLHPRHRLAAGAPDGIEVTELAGESILLPAVTTAVAETVSGLLNRTGRSTARVSFVSTGFLAQAHISRGSGVAIGVEEPRFGLVSRPLHYESQAVVVPLFAAWLPDHFRAAELESLAHTFADWLTARPAR